VPFAVRLDDATLVPPLQLASGDSRHRNHFPGCKAILHESSNMFETSAVQNVSNILGMQACGSNKEKKGVSD
jgi:hypothetical protein